VERIKLAQDRGNELIVGENRFYKMLGNVLLAEEDLEIFEMCCWRRMEKISWTDRVRNEEVLLRVNEQRNILN
jgi:hypothetical protein